MVHAGLPEQGRVRGIEPVVYPHGVSGEEKVRRRLSKGDQCSLNGLAILVDDCQASRSFSIALDVAAGNIQGQLLVCDERLADSGVSLGDCRCC
jgi:hypothetical protein